MIYSIYISVYLDTRSTKRSGKHPLRLRLFQKTPRKQKLYPTNFEFTEQEFLQLETSKRLSPEQRIIKHKIAQLISKAEAVKNSMDIFSFEEFELKMDYATNGTTTLKYHFELVINNLIERGSVGTAASYRQAINSLSGYYLIKHRRKIEDVDIVEMTPAFLNSYYSFMVDKRERSITTVGIYLRALRTVINYAIHNTHALKPERYPFGKGKFQIPAPKSRKLALDENKIRTLYRAEPKTEEQEMAKDFWFFSYLSNGMNVADIVSLKHKDITSDRLHFVRKKTARTATDALPIEVCLDSIQKAVIRKYGTEGDSNDYVFGVISKDDSAEEQYVKRKNFTRFINQHMQQLIKANGLDMKITTYTARHTYVTNAIRSNAGIEFVQQALGHANPNTTNTYVASLGFEKTKEVNNTLTKQLTEI